MSKHNSQGLSLKSMCYRSNVRPSIAYRVKFVKRAPDFWCESFLVHQKCILEALAPFACHTKKNKSKGSALMSICSSCHVPASVAWRVKFLERKPNLSNDFFQMLKNCNKWALAPIARQTPRFANSASEESASHHLHVNLGKNWAFAPIARQCTDFWFSTSEESASHHVKFMCNPEISHALYHDNPIALNNA